MPVELGYCPQGFQYQNGYQGSPYLYHHGIFGGAYKCFDVEQLFDLAEEYFYLPTAFVEFANCGGSPRELVGNDFYGLPIDIIPKRHPS